MMYPRSWTTANPVSCTIKTGAEAMNGTSANFAPGAEVQLADEGTISYVFPVEVVVVGALTDDDHRAIEQRIWGSFSEALSRSI